MFDSNELRRYFERRFVFMGVGLKHQMNFFGFPGTQARLRGTLNDSNGQI